MRQAEEGRLEGKVILLAITGSIAAYKACEVLRRLQDLGADVRVTMTRNGAEFVTPMTFAALSGHRVISGSFEDPYPERLAHIRWAEGCDAFCVVPASADFIAKMAHGIADDFPSTLHLAVEGEVLVAPAMEDHMWAHPAVRDNVSILRSRGVHIIEPSSGYLASGRVGPGRLADPSEIVEAITSAVQAELPFDTGGWLSGQRVLVTAGPTREHIDPVRVITNPSSGKMGYALAEVARQLGAEVDLVSGPTLLADPPGVEVVRVATTGEMAEAVEARATGANIVVMAAAPADFRMPESHAYKVKKADVSGLSLELVPTPDILSRLADLPGDRLLVGFAAETSDLEEGAAEKMTRKGCDMIVANQVGVAGFGFEADANEVVILDRLGGRRQSGPAAKIKIAAAIWAAVEEFRERAAGGDSSSPG